MKSPYKIYALLVLLLTLASCSNKNNDTTYGNAITGGSSGDAAILASLESQIVCSTQSTGSISTQSMPGTWNSYNQVNQNQNLNMNLNWGSYSNYNSTMWNVPSAYQMQPTGQRVKLGVRSQLDASGNVISRTKMNPVIPTPSASVTSYYGRTEMGDIILFRDFPGQNVREVIVSMCDRGFLGSYSYGNLQQAAQQFASIQPGRIPIRVLPSVNGGGCNLSQIIMGEIIVFFGAGAFPLYPAPLNLQLFGNPTSYCGTYLQQ